MGTDQFYPLLNRKWKTLKTYNMQAYYNTNNMQGAQLRLCNANAEAQEAEILKIFSSEPGSTFRTIDIEKQAGRKLSSNESRFSQAGNYSACQS